MTHTDEPDLYVWNIDKQPNQVRGAVSIRKAFYMVTSKSISREAAHVWVEGFTDKQPNQVCGAVSTRKALLAACQSLTSNLQPRSSRALLSCKAEPPGAHCTHAALHSFTNTHRPGPQVAGGVGRRGDPDGPHDAGGRVAVCARDQQVSNCSKTDCFSRFEAHATSLVPRSWYWTGQCLSASGAKPQPLKHPTAPRRASPRVRPTSWCWCGTWR